MFAPILCVCQEFELDVVRNMFYLPKVFHTIVFSVCSCGTFVVQSYQTGWCRFVRCGPL